MHRMKDATETLILREKKQEREHLGGMDGVGLYIEGEVPRGLM